jgi:hypothetical protein
MRLQSVGKRYGVRQHVAAGGSVLFVDHDPARLAGRADDHWRLGGDGRVTVIGAATGEAALPPPGTGDDVGSIDVGSIDAVGVELVGIELVSIELAGVEAAGLVRLADLPGVCRRGLYTTRTALGGWRTHSRGSRSAGGPPWLGGTRRRRCR